MARGSVRQCEAGVVGNVSVGPTDPAQTSNVEIFFREGSKLNVDLVSVRSVPFVFPKERIEQPVQVPHSLLPD